MLKQITRWQAANIISLCIIIFIGVVANILSLNGHTTGEIADTVPTWTTPAVYAFGIWVLIYFLLAAFAIYQLRPCQRDNLHVKKISGWFTLSSIANFGWVILWHYQQFALTVVAIVILLLALISIYIQLNSGEHHIDSNNRWFVNVPFSLYLGWISIITVANISVALDHSNWNGFGLTDTQWALLMMSLLCTIALVFIMTRSDYTFALVIVWGLLGMFSRQDNTTEVAYTALAAAATIIIIACLRFVNTYLWDAQAPLLTITERER